MADVQLWLPINGKYEHALSIPPDRCQDFSVHPLTWLRYIAFTIYGVEGHISTTQGGPAVDYYQPDIQPGLYYYVSQEPLLLDPDLMDDKTTNSSSISSAQGDFRTRIVDRDTTCIISGENVFVEACHIVPHSKGHTYMTSLMDHKCQDLKPPLCEINDTRNGILLSTGMHSAFGTSRVAFLRTPNFAMAVTDVALVKQPLYETVHYEVDPQQSDCRLTLQHFNDPGITNVTLAPHNSDARRSNSSEWPPPIMFDVSYGSAVLKAWGMPKFVNATRISVHSIYYDDGDIGERGPGGSRDKKQQRQLELQVRADKRRGANDSESLGYTDLVLGLWMQNARKNVAQASAMTAEKNRTKVQTWLESIKG